MLNCILIPNTLHCNYETTHPLQLPLQYEQVLLLFFTAFFHRRVDSIERSRSRHWMNKRDKKSRFTAGKGVGIVLFNMHLATLGLAQFYPFAHRSIEISIQWREKGERTGKRARASGREQAGMVSLIQLQLESSRSSMAQIKIALPEETAILFMFSRRCVSFTATSTLFCLLYQAIFLSLLNNLSLTFHGHDDRAVVSSKRI